MTTSGHGVTHVVTSDGSDLRRISHGNGVDYSADISPDSSRVVYATSKHKTRDVWGGAIANFEIETSRLDGSDRRRLTENIYLDASPAWSPDGERIAFVKLGADDRGFYTIAPDGTDERLVAPFGEDVRGTVPDLGPVWSPDGRTIAFAAGYRSHNSQWNVVYTVEADGSGLRRLFVDKGDYFLTRIMHITWSPDGQRIAFSYTTGSQTTPRGEWDTKLYIVGRDGDGLQEIPGSSEAVSGLGGIANLEWSPDGAEILIASGGVFLINTEDFELRKVAGQGIATWSPDGSRIAVFSEARDDWLVSMQKDGSDVRVLMRLDEDGRLVAGNPR